LRNRGIKFRIARRGVDSLSWLAKYRRLTVCYEGRADIRDALLHLGSSLICFNLLSGTMAGNLLIWDQGTVSSCGNKD